ncbi:MAG: Na+/H+ antiporter NhaA [Thermomicrobiales bacterium]|nr:Na+/H+ antiporter NhaA [Thermomicrobiales bacterium]MCO5219965.1 Na+/H+ antiporter NhaA [Thermomicrobiales bacterium]
MAESRLGALRRWLSLETTSGVLLLLAATVALLWANSPWRDAYQSLSDVTIGPGALHLDLTLSAWAADGLLAIFFFVVGLELKQELVTGSLRNPREAAVPVFAAAGGMVVPAVVYVTILQWSGSDSGMRGWAIPTATDIAFALAVLAIFGRGLPVALRVFLLTLAVVDDLLAIIVIALFYTSGVDLLPLGGALAAILAFTYYVRIPRPSALVLVLLAFTAWTAMHASGVHATIAGALLGLSVPALPMHGEWDARTQRFEHLFRPFSAGIALPLFAFFAAGVNIVDGEGVGSVIREPVAVAVVAGLVLGKIAGVLGTTALVTWLAPFRLPDALGVRDLIPVGFLTGIGFTVSLLIAKLSFSDPSLGASATMAVLVGSLISATLAAILLRWDAQKSRSIDMNRDGIPDMDQRVLQDPADW